ncbi:hypothetical protein P152DRAFT_469536 [Eremomyces bilateralis CBS 781.70]|uniref:Ubiquitin 3 binding protein But2 C-terminal domain-containing protein n=1 Tax=Eremomyces bilateralis CBS 781.70 TaxID=1392243 RepID=A0A6G1GGC1_9PEZI|nr:uncharacterized protein P152DRAFT_469536 [Eremomyces bilateralis CBS 781.70]KAF1817042.1 hypothetical protein P152DRAFT_469536 [Eremomyces bilateralis CBS 781.70]
MQYLLAASSILGGVSALVARDAPCCFHLSADGGPGGPVGQLDDGQNRIGQGLPEANYCLDNNGGLTDQDGRGCILTPPTTQWQCDEGATPDGGFSVGNDGGLKHDGSTTFIACPTGDNGGWNIYTERIDGEPLCTEITLTADSCGSGAPPTEGKPSEPAGTQPAQTQPAGTEPTGDHPSPSQPAGTEPAGDHPSPSQPAGTEPVGDHPSPSHPAESQPTGGHPTLSPPYLNQTTTGSPGGDGAGGSQPTGGNPSTTSNPAKTQPAGSKPAETQPVATNPAETPSTPPSESCPVDEDLSGPYEAPHLIIPVDSSKPDEVPGTSYFGQVTPTVSSIFNFDIPESYAGSKCSIIFLFPERSRLETSNYTISGTGEVQFGLLDSPASEQTSFNTSPKIKTDLGKEMLAPGNSYQIETLECPAGETIAISMVSSKGTDFEWFEDYNPAPIGLWVTKC